MTKVFDLHLVSNASEKFSSIQIKDARKMRKEHSKTEWKPIRNFTVLTKTNQTDKLYGERDDA